MLTLKLSPKLNVEAFSVKVSNVENNPNSLKTLPLTIYVATHYTWPSRSERVHHVRIYTGENPQKIQTFA